MFRLFPSAKSAARLDIGALETPKCRSPRSGSRNGANILDRRIGVDAPIVHKEIGVCCMLGYISDHATLKHIQAYLDGLMHSISHHLSDGGSTALQDQDLGMLVRGRLEKHSGISQVRSLRGDCRSAVLAAHSKAAHAFTVRRLHLL